jgi:3-oxoacyl-[acyl-carrier protein] reductase
VETNNSSPVLITGASNGIGYATALQLCKNAVPVVALSRNEENLNALKKEAGGNCKILKFDLLKEIPAALPAKLAELGIHSLQGVVHNAGFLVNKPFEEINSEELLSVYRTNVFAPFQLTQALLPLLKKSKQSHIVHISSMGGVQGSVKFSGLSAYSSSKGALSILTECLALELKEYNISVNCLSLGAVQTEMLNQAFPGYQAPMQPSDIASFIAWFVTMGNKFFNGKILPVAISTP